MIWVVVQNYGPFLVWESILKGGIDIDDVDNIDTDL